MIIHQIFLLFMFITIKHTSCNLLNIGPCNFMDTVNITEGGWIDPNGDYHYKDIVFKHGTFAEYNYIVENLTERITVERHYRGCICLYKNCIRICCKGDSKKNCVITDTLVNIPVGEDDETNITLSSNQFGILQGKPCNEMFKLEPFDYEYDKWTFLKNGSIEYDDSGQLVKTDEYCFSQNLTESGNYVTEVMLCYHPPSDPRLTLYPIGMILSIPFLIITFCVYAFIPELRNLHGKCLMCYVFSLTCLYICLSAVQLDNDNVTLESLLCKLLGYSIYSSVLLCFFWLNVMCFDIWSTFKGGISRGHGVDNRRFLFYCLYSFGMSFALTITAFIVDATAIINEKLRPKIGINRCWMQNSRIVEFIYVYTPITVIMTINIILYSVTAYRIWRVQKETSVIRNGESQKHSKMEADTDRFFLYLRLFIIMGATWCMESISWVFDNSIIFYASDILNCLQGVIIFFLFVWKPKIKNLIIRRYRSIRKLPPVTSSQHAHSNSNRTESSRISSDANTASQAEKPILME